MRKFFFILIVSVLTLALSITLVAIKWNVLDIISIDIKNFIGDKKTQQISISYGDNSQDADGVLWGTEAYLTIMEEPNGQKEVDAINNYLKVKNIKVRVEWASEKNPSNIVCVGPNCLHKYDLDKFAQVFKTNNWSMRPMFSPIYPKPGQKFSDADILDYVNYIDWFITRYKKDAKIQYIELINNPIMLLVDKQMTLPQLVQFQNQTYDRIKNKHPEILIGSHGVECGEDTETLDMIKYFLDKNNGVKFDYWAFHGYLDNNGNPIMKSSNSYCRISGYNAVRNKMDENGWQNRLMIDTEHVLSNGGADIDPNLDKIEAIKYVQELVLKKGLKDKDNKPLLSGITPLKMLERGNAGEGIWGSLFHDGSLTKSINATGKLLSMLKKYHHVSRINGAFGDNTEQVWIEKFQSSNGKELYIFFKPLISSVAPNEIDQKPLIYNLTLSQMPTAVTITSIDGSVTNSNVNQTITLDVINSPQYLEITY